MKNSKKSNIQIPNQNKSIPTAKVPTISLLDSMVDSREFESLLKHQKVNVNIQDEINRALKDISDLRKRPCIAYMANVVNSNVKAVTSIEYGDDLPFSELIRYQ